MSKRAPRCSLPIDPCFVFTVRSSSRSSNINTHTHSRREGSDIIRDCQRPGERRKNVIVEARRSACISNLFFDTYPLYLHVYVLGPKRTKQRKALKCSIRCNVDSMNSCLQHTNSHYVSNTWCVPWIFEGAPDCFNRTQL